jgi:hypothetical protein
MTIWRLTWPHGPQHTTELRIADCLTEATAEQLRDGLKALGYGTTAIAAVEVNDA